MKRPSFLTAFILSAFAASCLAEETPNPFVKKADATKPEPPPGASFASLLENILVPPDLLDDWLREHPMKEDASALREAVQGWVVEGKAKLDHTSFSYGSAGRKTTNSVILEKIFPTELAPNGPGVWPSTTSFDTRNLGQDMGTGISSAADAPVLWLSDEHVEMLSSNSWVPLVEKTRQPSDSFFPVIRSKRVDHGDPNNTVSRNYSFPESLAPKEKIDFSKPQGSAFKPDLVQLVSRFDPVDESNPNETLSRLTFYRGSIATSPQLPAMKNPDISRLSIRTIRVPLLAFSTWLQNRNPLAATTEACSAAEDWRKEGKARNVGELTTRISLGSQATLVNIEEFTYPTEWEPMNEQVVLERWEEGKKLHGKDGVATMKRVEASPRTGTDAASLPCAFDTRNLGITATVVLSNDDQGLSLNCEWERVLHLDNIPSQRIKVDQEWIPDIVMPLFTASRISADVRIRPDQWTLLGANVEYLKTEKLDRDHCLLVFVKVE